MSGGIKGGSLANLAIRNDATGEIAFFSPLNFYRAFSMSKEWSKLTKLYVHLIITLIVLSILAVPVLAVVLFGSGFSDHTLTPLIALFTGSMGVAAFSLLFIGLAHALFNRHSLSKIYKSYTIDIMNMDFSGATTNSFGSSQPAAKFLGLPFASGVVTAGGLSIYAIIILTSLVLHMHSNDVAELHQGANSLPHSLISNDVNDQHPLRAPPQPQPQPQPQQQVESRPERHNPTQRQRETSVAERPSNESPPLGWPDEVEHTRFGVIEIYSNKLYLNGKPTPITGQRKLRMTKLLPWGDEDLLLVTSLGNADCPAKFTVIRLAASYLKNTPFFGNCNLQMSWGSTPDRITFSEPPFEDKPEAAYSYTPSSAELSGNY